MPVKVRCQSCEKVFAAPDAARGKAVKCPGCQERVKVPAAVAPAKTKGPPKKKAAAPEEHDHEEFIKNLDLDSIEDTEVKVCPKCGHEAAEEAYECENCGLNFESGLTKDKQKGVDPKIFFRVVWKNSMEFLKQNRSFAIRTTMYSMSYSLAFLFFSFMVGWCTSFPPRMFWLGLAVVAYMVPFGWVWFLNGEIIKATLEKKDKLPRTNFDMFTCVALGIKFHLWHAAMATQLVLPVVGFFLIRSGQKIPGIVVLALGELLLFLTVPQVMVHMVMPVTLRGWLAHVQFQAFGKTFLGCAYWCGITAAVMFPLLIPVGLACGLTQRSLGEFIRVELDNAAANSLKGDDLAALRDAINNPKKGEAPPKFDENDPRYVNQPLPWTKIIIPAIGLIMSQMMFGFSAVFAMRANGLLAFYYKKHMKLVSMAKELVWVDKKKLKEQMLENETPDQKKKRKQNEMIANTVAIVIVLGIVAGAAWYLLKPSKPEAAPVDQPAGAVDPAAAMPAGVPAGAAPP